MPIPLLHLLGTDPPSPKALVIPALVDVNHRVCGGSRTVPPPPGGEMQYFPKTHYQQFTGITKNEMITINHRHVTVRYQQITGIHIPCIIRRIRRSWQFAGTIGDLPAITADQKKIPKCR